MLHVLRSRYAYLKILLIDKIVMTGLVTFNCLNKALQVIKQSALSFCGMSFLGKDYFLQLPPVKNSISLQQEIREHKVLSGFLWVRAPKLFEFHQIVSHSGDPAFA